VVTTEPEWPDAIEIDRVVPASGNMSIGPRQFWLGTARTGQRVRFWIDTVTVHLSTGGWRVKTVPSRLSAVDPETSAAPGSRNSGQARACPAQRAARKPDPRWPRPGTDHATTRIHTSAIA